MIALPIDLHLDEITQKIFSDHPVILSASPGSGKTTRVPARLLLALRQKKNTKKIVVIVPKRLAAVAACDRIATENDWQFGVDVGYVVRFDSNFSPETQLIFMTEGLFLKKIQDPHFWNDVGFIILDEFHERSSNIDLILGLCFERKILNNDLQIIVMSATLNTEKLKKYFGEHHLIEINQKPFALNIVYQKNPQNLICDSKFYENLKLVTLLAYKTSKKDILIFLPGFREILKTQNILKPVLPNTQIEFAYGGLTLAEQKRILNKTSSERRIILATNIAESSLTLPDLDCVIDSGLEKIVVREKKMGFSQLETVRISKFSAIQRAGRAARTGEGYCFKLWHEIDDRSMPEQKRPEILESNLLEEILLLSDLGTTDFLNFSWLDQPDSQKIDVAIKKLLLWNLINTDFTITASGKLISKIPLDLMNALLFYELCRAGLKNQACHFFAKLETVDISKRAKWNPYDLNTDLDYLFALPMATTEKKIEAQLKKLAEKYTPEHSLDFESALLEIFSKYFPERICLKKTNGNGLSASGRGVEFSDSSAIQSDKIANDYIIALSGFEKSQSVTNVQLGVGYSRGQATLILKKYLQIEDKIEYKPETHKFMKRTVQKFGEFVFTESSPETLSQSELANNWKLFVLKTPSAFLRLNDSYDKLIIKFNFLKDKKSILKISDLDFIFLDNFDILLSKILTDHIADFQEFMAVDFVFYLNDIISENLKNYVSQLKDSVQLPTGRVVQIDYSDPKAPMISAKIQDFFQWHHTPKILNELIPYTIQLLAPNMRPAQITNDLNNFWQNSYKEVRKDLRARYPKHNWPEDVLNYK